MSIPAYRNLKAELAKALGADTSPLKNKSTDIQFMKIITGAFVAPGILNPRESIAYFGFVHDGMEHTVALGFKLWQPKKGESK
jgi:hypothetical protein